MNKELSTGFSQLKNNFLMKDGWIIAEQVFDKEQIVTTGSNFMFGNGYLGYRGTFEEWGKDEYVACIVTDTYDTADGKWNELCNVPNGLFVKLQFNGEQVDIGSGDISDYQRSIDLRHGLLNRSFSWQHSAGQVEVSTEKFASMTSLNTLALHYRITAKNSGEVTLLSGIDGDVWSLNGDHFQTMHPSQEGELLAITSTTKELATDIAVVEGVNIQGGSLKNEEVVKQDKQIFRKFVLEVRAGETISLMKFVEIRHSNECDAPKAEAIVALQQDLENGYQKIKSAHQQAWEDIWGSTDIQIEGDEAAQTLTRFNLFQNIIATPSHASLPIGARGLSCQAYQGAAFWDQEIFNMPMFLYTAPAAARNILKYRYDTLGGARRKAKELGYEGAYYAWISGKTGDELCPSFFFKDVLTGRPIRNHFNCWQMHISPDIAYAIWHYYEATDDWQFIVEYGAEMFFEIARFLFAFGFYKSFRDRYELIRLLGPDEYHENVDNNAFSNYQTKYALEKACYVFDHLKASNSIALGKLMEKLSLSEQEVANWHDMAAKIYLPQPDPETKLIEQFDGYFALEDTTPAVIKTRLQDPGEYHGWPNGIAVHTQVLKQADVIQLFCLHDDFDKEILQANYDYYEPRTEHGSSLSPSAYAIVASKIGYVDEAYRNFMKSCFVDIANTGKAVSGGTFIGGIHTAACGSVWNMTTVGFAGFAIHDNALRFDPHIPDHWSRLAFHMKYKGQGFNVEITGKKLELTADSDNSAAIPYFSNSGEIANLAPGERATIGA